MRAALSTAARISAPGRRQFPGQAQRYPARSCGGKATALEHHRTPVARAARRSCATPINAEIAAGVMFEPGDHAQQLISAPEGLTKTSISSPVLMSRLDVRQHFHVAIGFTLSGSIRAMVPPPSNFLCQNSRPRPQGHLPPRRKGDAQPWINLLPLPSGRVTSAAPPRRRRRRWFQRRPSA